LRRGLTFDKRSPSHTRNRHRSDTRKEANLT
jgi:hypothetical protein